MKSPTHDSIGRRERIQLCKRRNFVNLIDHKLLLTRHVTGDQVFWLCLKLFLDDLIVAVVSVFVGWEPMPGKLACHQVDHYVGESFEIVPSALLLEKV